MTAAANDPNPYRSPADLSLERPPAPPVATGRRSIIRTMWRGITTGVVFGAVGGLAAGGSISFAIIVATAIAPPLRDPPSPLSFMLGEPVIIMLPIAGLIDAVIAGAAMGGLMTCLALMQRRRHIRPLGHLGGALTAIIGVWAGQAGADIAASRASSSRGNSWAQASDY